MIVSNNRFLQKVNPQISRAIADGGSSLNHSEIQRLARQMVDLGIWGNLKFWAHSGLVKTRASGDDTFVSKAYDISGNNNDIPQATESYQPKLVSTGIQFDGTNDHLKNDTMSSISFSGEITALVWLHPSVKVNCSPFSSTDDDQSKQRVSVDFPWNNNLSWDCGYSESEWGFDRQQPAWSSNYLNVSMWCFTKNVSAGTMTIYRNASSINSVTNKSQGIPTLHRLSIGSLLDTIDYGLFNGVINDLRIISAVLTTSQMTAIYDATKGYYGL
jgi:hypothetical protein